MSNYKVEFHPHGTPVISLTYEVLAEANKMYASIRKGDYLPERREDTVTACAIIMTKDGQVIKSGFLTAEARIKYRCLPFKFKCNHRRVSGGYCIACSKKIHKF